MKRACIRSGLAILFFVGGAVLGQSPETQGAGAAITPTQVSIPVAAAPSASTAAPAASAQASAPTHPVAFQYPPGYDTRLKIHKLASYASLPLFATEVYLGESLDSNPNNGDKGAHAIVGAGIVGLFAVNTVTGGWNLWDSRKNPDGRSLRMAHSLLEMAADAGFVATVATAPKTHGPAAAMFATNAATHRDIAFVSVGLATMGYLLMLFRHR